MMEKAQKRNGLFWTKCQNIAFPFFVARRYLFSKKSHNAINIVSAVSAAGVCVGAGALICVLSVLNGFGSLFTDMFSAFDPDIKITLVQGKTFSTDTPAFRELREAGNVAVFTEVIEENALLRFRDKQMPATVKGVDETFRQMTMIDSIMFDGDFTLYDGAFERSVPGIGVAGRLGLNAHFIDPLNIYAPKRTARVNLVRPETSFNQQGTFVSGIFSVKQPEYDDNFILVSLKLARALFEYDEHTASAVELKLAENIDVKNFQKEIRKLLGDNFHVKNRHEQHESFFNLMKIEKFATYLILSLILFIASFNIIGSLSMLIIDKKADIETLRSLGADRRLIKKIFLFEGWMISALGALSGLTIGVVICLLQQYFGLIKLGGGGQMYVVEAYPVIVSPGDILIVFFTVLLMGFFTAWYPVRYLGKKNNL
jgi:lipoprotein-releasing system permease protein